MIDMLLGLLALIGAGIDIFGAKAASMDIADYGNNKHSREATGKTRQIDDSHVLLEDYGLMMTIEPEEEKSKIKTRRKDDSAEMFYDYYLNEKKQEAKKIEELAEQERERKRLTDDMLWYL